jgi:hypothetical protein
MMEILLRESGSGAQTLAATGAARGEHLAAAGRGEASAEAVTALAHQFAGLISPLHGWFSADRAICLLAATCLLAMCLLAIRLLELELSPVM